MNASRIWVNSGYTRRRYATHCLFQSLFYSRIIEAKSPGNGFSARVPRLLPQLSLSLSLPFFLSSLSTFKVVYLSATFLFCISIFINLALFHSFASSVQYLSHCYHYFSLKLDRSVFPVVSVIAIESIRHGVIGGGRSRGGSVKIIGVPDQGNYWASLHSTAIISVAERLQLENAKRLTEAVVSRLPDRMDIRT